MGKNVEIRNPNAAMSSRQSYMMYLMTGVDVRETDLTKGLASGVIDNIVNGKCYHARVTCAGLENAVIKRKDVHKSHRKDTKPRGYAAAMAAVTEEEAPTPKPKAKPAAKNKTAKKQTKAEQLGLDAVDLDDPRVQAMLKAFATT